MARSFSGTPVSVRRYLYFLLLAFTAAIVSLIIYFWSERELIANREFENSVLWKKLKSLHGQNAQINANNSASQSVDNRDAEFSLLKLISRHNASMSVGKESRQTAKKEEADPDAPPNFNVHVFYYPWYGNPEKDGKYMHWNHQYLPHWRKEVADKWAKGNHKPPDDIGANFYPQLGPYSSSDPDVINTHMAQIRSAGAGEI
jgi:hypothetical protein